MADRQSERWRLAERARSHPWSQLWSHSPPSSTIRSHSRMQVSGRDGRSDVPRRPASDDLLSGQTAGILAMLRPASGRGHRRSCPELVQAIQSRSWPEQSAMPTPTTVGQSTPARRRRVSHA